MKEIFKQNRFFLIPYFLVFLILIGTVLVISKGEIHLFVNRFHCSFCDFFFKYYTNIGDGLTIVIIAVLFVLFSYRQTIMILSTLIVSGLLSQFFKKVIFSDVVRPVKYFENIADLHLVDGVKTLLYHSFPSGHTTTAFTFFFYLSVISKNPYLKLLWFILASLVGYSRMYLSHHFLPDVLFGSFLGVITTFMFVLLLDKSLDVKSLNRGLIKK